jgi:hypothetical protein
MKAAKILCPEKEQLFKNISLSANTVAERVNDMAGDMKCQLKESVKLLWRCQLQLTKTQT